MKVTPARTKTEVIKFALENNIQKNKLQKLKRYRGELEIEIKLGLNRLSATRSLGFLRGRIKRSRSRINNTALEYLF